MTTTSPSTEQTSAASAPAAAPEAKETLFGRLFGTKLLFWVIVVVLAGADLGTKEWAEQTITVPTQKEFMALRKWEAPRREYRDDLPENGVEFVPGLLHFKWAENHGAAFSIGTGSRYALTFLSIGVLAVLLFIMVGTPKRRWFKLVCLGLICGGALGNIYDRFFFQTVDPIYSLDGETVNPNYGKATTAVRDFLYWPFDIPVYSTWGLSDEDISKGNTRKWPIFNIADCAIVTGVIGLAGIIALSKEERRKPEPNRQDTVAQA